MAYNRRSYSRFLAPDVQMQFPLLDLHIHACPIQRLDPASGVNRPEDDWVIVGGQRLAVQRVPNIDQTLFSISFEQLHHELAQFDRMYIEPDGSLVWTSATNERRWQIDAMIYDRNDRVQRIEVKGTCPLTAWRQLLQACGWPQYRLVCFLQSSGCIVGIEELERLWTAS